MQLHYRALRIALLLSGLGFAAPVLVYQQNFDSYASAKPTFGDTIGYVLRADTFGLAALQTGLDSTKSANASIVLNPDSLRGGKVVFSAWTKSSDLTARPNRWNGIKVMLVTEDSAGAKNYPQLSWPDSVKSWNWTRSWKVASLPQNLKKATLVVGMELMAGKVWFDSIRVERVARATAPARDPSIPIPSFSPTRFRGAMIGTGKVDSAAVRTFGEWKGNLLRWQLNAPSGHDSGLLGKNFDAELAAQLNVMDTSLPLCQKAGIMVVVDLHNLSHGLFHDRAAQSRLIETWKKIVTRFHRHPAIWAWDLANEPIEDEWSDGVLFWDELADTIAREIRKIDTSKVIIVEPASGGGARELPNMKPLGYDRGYDIPKVVYSFHFYEPGNLTHQGVTGHNPIGTSYPDSISGTYWDSAQMRKALRPAYEFQQRYRVPMYVGEFSCIRWAPNQSALRWLTDLTRLFEEAGWDWTYHAYREYHGWSVEYSDSATDMKVYASTPRKSLLLDLFARNNNPYTPASVPPRSHADIPSPRWRLMGNSTLFVENLPVGARIALVRPDGSRAQEQKSTGAGVTFHGVSKGLWLLRMQSSAGAKTLPIVLL